MTDTRARIQRLMALLDHGRTFDLGAECQRALPALLDRLEKLEKVLVLSDLYHKGVWQCSKGDISGKELAKMRSDLGIAIIDADKP